jgi:hypothetical protein
MTRCRIIRLARLVATKAAPHIVRKKGCPRAVVPPQSEDVMG